jgi:hypothetical protein
MNKTILKDSKGEPDRIIQQDLQERGEKVHVRNRQLWSKYLVKKLSANGIVVRKRHSAKVRRREDNQNFWRGFLWER